MIEGLKPLFNKILFPFAWTLERFGLHPNILTISGVAVFGIAGYITIIGYWKVAVVIGIVGACLDALDGVVARKFNKMSTFGAILDSTCDRFTEILWIGSILAYYYYNQRLSTLVLYGSFGAVTGSIMVSYVKARAEAAGIHCSKGLFQRPERLIFLALFQIAGTKYMPWGLATLAFLSYFTALQRIMLVWNVSKNHSK